MIENEREKVLINLMLFFLNNESKSIAFLIQILNGLGVVKETSLIFDILKGKNLIENSNKEGYYSITKEGKENLNKVDLNQMIFQIKLCFSDRSFTNTIMGIINDRLK